MYVSFFSFLFIGFEGGTRVVGVERWRNHNQLGQQSYVWWFIVAPRYMYQSYYKHGSKGHESVGQSIDQQRTGRQSTCTVHVCKLTCMCTSLRDVAVAVHVAAAASKGIQVAHYMYHLQWARYEHRSEGYGGREQRRSRQECEQAMADAKKITQELTADSWRQYERSEEKEWLVLGLPWLLRKKSRKKVPPRCRSLCTSHAHGGKNPTIIKQILSWLHILHFDKSFVELHPGITSP